MKPPRRRKRDETRDPGPRHFDLEQKSNEQEEEGGGYARRRRPGEHPKVPLFDLPNRGG